MGMTRTMITKRFTFDAAHKLEHHDGKCSQMHGHTYTLEITVEGVPLPVAPGFPKSGMIVDFGDLKQLVVDHLLSKIDHTVLNDAFSYTTAEVMAQEIFTMLEPAIAAITDIHCIPALPPTFEEILKVSAPILRRVRLWETPDSYAEVIVSAAAEGLFAFEKMVVDLLEETLLKVE